MNPSAQQQTDAQLLRRTRAGDTSAYDELHRRHLPDARRVARVVTHDREEAEDIVAEAFARVLAKLRAGRGPDDVLTPYLRTVIRRLAVDRHRTARHEDRAADAAMLGELPTADDEIDRAPERHLVRTAFESLPERWQRVLWHTEIEGKPPAALTPDLGSSPNAVAALAYRAREGLRQAFLTIHLSAVAPAECRQYVPMLAAYIRQTLSEDEDIAVAMHLDRCAHCRERRNELLLLASDVRAVLVPALLGTLAGSGITAAPSGAAALAGTESVADPATAGVVAIDTDTSAGGASRIRPRSLARAAATSVVSAAAAAAVAFAAISAMSPPERISEPVAAPPPATSAIQTAVVSVPSAARNPSSELPQEETASPTEEPVEEAAEPTDSQPSAEPPASEEEPAGDDADRDDESAEPAPSEPLQTDPPESRRSEPTSNSKPTPKLEPQTESQPEPRADRGPGSDRNRGSDRESDGEENWWGWDGESDYDWTGKPPPWVCRLLPWLPPCD